MSMFFQISPQFRCPSLRHTMFFVAFLVLGLSQVPLGWALPAFPGAEGFGAETRGGRGGVVKVVTTLSGSGAGSFREAMLTTQPRIIVFRVSGVIDLGGDINLTEAHSYVTV